MNFIYKIFSYIFRRNKTPKNDPILLDYAKIGDVKGVKRLIRKGVDLDIEDNYSKTALMWASCYNHIEVVKLLIKAGANLNIQDNEGWTALMVASCYNHKELVKLLIEAKANLDIVDNRGKTALILASGKNNIVVVKLLLDNFADEYVVDDYGGSFYNYLSPYSKKDIERYHPMAIQNAMLAGGVFDDIMNLDNFAKNGCVEGVKSFIEIGVDLDTQDENGMTALMWSCYYNYEETVKLLIDAGANLDIEDNWGNTALMIASRNNNNNIEIVKQLIDAGADLNIQVADSSRLAGMTALMIACYYNNIEIVKLLIDAGANLDIEDNWGNTAYSRFYIEWNRSG